MTRQLKFKGLDKVTPGGAVKGFKSGQVATMCTRARRKLTKLRHKIRHEPLYTEKAAGKPSPTEPRIASMLPSMQTKGTLGFQG